MIAVRSEEEIAILREADQMVAEVLATLVSHVADGVVTNDLDATAEKMIRGFGATPSFLGYNGFTKSTCISVDSEIIHGIPGPRKLKAGEIVSIDVGVHHRGYHGDAAITVACGKVDEDRQRLMNVTDLALSRAVAAAKAGNFLVEIGRAVQTTCEAAGYSVVRQFVGHGIGTRMHEDPQIPNYVTRERGPRLRAGMVLAIEPMINMGTHRVSMLDDGWTAVTADGKPSAHFEHSVVVREHGGEILSSTPKLVWGQRTN